ncbi:MAG: hypothetical protein ACLR06_13105 [Christensenellaceae bacterium]
MTEVAAGSKGNKTFYAKWEKNAEENSSGNSSGNSSSGSSSEKESTETTAGCNSSMIGGTLGGAAILSCVLAFTKSADRIRSKKTASFSFRRRDGRKKRP